MLPCILLFKFNIVNLKQVVGQIHCVFIGERHVWPLAVHSLERCVWRSDLFFIGGFRGVIAESSRSRRGVVAEWVPGSLFFVGQNGGVAVESSRSRSSPRHGGSRSGLVFNRWDGGVGAESARSRRGVTAGPLRESLFLWAGFGHHDVHASHHHQHTNLCNHVACCCCRCCCCCTAWCCSRRHPQPAEWASVCHWG